MADHQDAVPTPISDAETGVSRRTLLKGAAVGAGSLMLKGGVAGAGAFLLNRTGQAAAQEMLPGSSVRPYVLPSMNGVDTVAVLTVGDAAENGYRMVGIPDGLGAFGDGDTFTLLMNHELRATNGVERGHGSRGALVSRWTIERSTLRVLEGQDHVTSPANMYLWDPATGTYTPGTTALERLCSADMPAVSATHFRDLGTVDRMLLNGEEFNDGRAWAWIASGEYAGTVWQLPRLGRWAFENVVLSPFARELTIGFPQDDSNLNTAPVASDYPSEVYVYVGTKQATGTPIERAGLTNGKMYAIRAWRGSEPLAEESNQNGIGTEATGYVNAARFDLVEIGPNGDVSRLTALQQEEDTIAKGATRFLRPEDGAWDPRGDHDGNFYFVTTANITSNSRLWHVQFDDMDHPELGGTIEILLTATPGRMFDNITIDRFGRLLLQEDTGNDPWISKIWLYGIDSGRLMEVAHHDQALFEPGGANFFTQDEESSGIIDAAPILGDGWFLLVVQVHSDNPDPELVEYGQLLALYVDPALGR